MDSFLKNINDMVDSMPVAGHVKGAFHYVLGDKEGGDKAMKAATRNVGVIAGGIGGSMLGGPVGAAAGGAAGGLFMDSFISLCEFADKGETAKPYGSVETITRIIDDPRDGGNYVELTVTTALDGLTGYRHRHRHR